MVFMILYFGRPYIDMVRKRGSNNTKKQRLLKCENALPLTPRQRTIFCHQRLRATSQFRILVTWPEHEDGHRNLDDWLRRVLSYLNVADPRFKAIGMPYLEYMENQPPELKWYGQVLGCGHASSQRCHQSAQESRRPLFNAVPRAGTKDQGPGLHGDGDYNG